MEAVSCSSAFILLRLREYLLQVSAIVYTFVTVTSRLVFIAESLGHFIYRGTNKKSCFIRGRRCGWKQDNENHRILPDVLENNFAVISIIYNMVASTL